MGDYEELSQLFKDFAHEGSLEHKTIKAYVMIVFHEALASGLQGQALRRSINESLSVLTVETEKLMQSVGALYGNDHG